MDMNYKTSIDEYQNQIIKQCMSSLFKQFPDNNLQFLIQSGAKGKQCTDDYDSYIECLRINCECYANVMFTWSTGIRR
jgi:hypothetical protein